MRYEEGIFKPLQYKTKIFLLVSVPKQSLLEGLDGSNDNINMYSMYLRGSIIGLLHMNDNIHSFVLFVFLSG